MLINKREAFVVCMEKGADGCAAGVKGPSRDSVKLVSLVVVVEQADAMIVDKIIAGARCAETVEIGLVGGLAQ